MSAFAQKQTLETLPRFACLLQKSYSQANMDKGYSLYNHGTSPLASGVNKKYHKLHLVVSNLTSAELDQKI